MCRSWRSIGASFCPTSNGKATQLYKEGGWNCGGDIHQEWQSQRVRTNSRWLRRLQDWARAVGTVRSGKKCLLILCRKSLVASLSINGYNWFWNAFQFSPYFKISKWWDIANDNLESHYKSIWFNRSWIYLFHELSQFTNFRNLHYCAS